ncbi:MAG: hypothetical protein E7388_03270 [Ruminococcaceae bacterium]|nr:hypothetical protein [Oscillospiraceae bacterium]
MLKNTFLILLTIILTLTVVSAPVIISAASVEDQLTEEQVEATPIVDENGDEIAFEVGDGGTRNSGGAIFIMVAVVLIGIWLIADGIRSYIKRSKKEREKFFNGNKE